MAVFLTDAALFPLVLTLGAYQVALWLQKKLKNNPLCNPILVSILLVIAVLLVTGVSVDTYRSGTSCIQWLLTPATVCLALPLYRQVQILKKNLPAITVGIAAGTVTSLVFILLGCKALGLDRQVTVSLLPKSITTAMGIVLSSKNGGIEALTTVAIIVTGILGNISGRTLCKLLKITHPIAQGVGFGTASHVIGTSRAAQLDSLAGAVSSLSLAVSGILTAILFPIFCLLA